MTLGERRALRPHMAVHGRECVIDGVPASRLVVEHGTPLYVTSVTAFEDRLRAMSDALHAAFPQSRVYYALKANWGRPLVEAVCRAGEGFDIVSGGEWAHLESCGVDPARVCFAGVGKTTDEIETALAASVGILNIEHLSELDHALAVLERRPSATVLALRLNPCVDVDTHPHLRTGALDSKFGMRSEEILGALSSPAWRDRLGRLSARGGTVAQSVRGIHVHVGSQLLKGTLLEGVVSSVMDLAEGLVGCGLPIDHLDFGGGLGVPHTGVPHDGSDIRGHMASLRSAVFGALRNRPQLVDRWGQRLERASVGIEPGRSLVASSTVFLTRVLYTRSNGDEHRFAYVDGGMNDFPRPSLYGARHDVCMAWAHPHASPQGGALSAAQLAGVAEAVRGGAGLQIVGPVCESADVLRRDPSPEELPEVTPGDVLAFFEAGAYCRSMASAYNLRPLPRTVYVQRGEVVFTDGT